MNMFNDPSKEQLKQIMLRVCTSEEYFYYPTCLYDGRIYIQQFPANTNAIETRTPNITYYCPKDTLSDDHVEKMLNDLKGQWDKEPRMSMSDNPSKEQLKQMLKKCTGEELYGIYCDIRGVVSTLPHPKDDPDLIEFSRLYRNWDRARYLMDTYRPKDDLSDTEVEDKFNHMMKRWDDHVEGWRHFTAKPLYLRVPNS